MPTTRLWRYSPVIPSRSSIISVFILGMWLTSNECFCMVWDGKYCYFFLPVYSAVPALLYKENNFSFSFELSQCLCLRSTGHIYIYMYNLYIFYIYIIYIFMLFIYNIYVGLYLDTFFFHWIFCQSSCQYHHVLIIHELMK